MDLLGGFDFGRLIRMFLPGVVVLGGIVLFLDAFYALLPSTPGPGAAVIHYALGRQTFLLATSIPLSLICGLLVNSFIFVTNLSGFVGGAREQPEPMMGLVTQLIADCDREGAKATLQTLTRDWTEKDLSIESFLLPILTPERIVYLKGHFYYYGQFNLAFGLAIMFAELAAATWMSVYWHTRYNQGSTFLWFLVASAAVCFGLVFLLYHSARKNILGNRRVDLSFYVGALCLPKCGG